MKYFTPELHARTCSLNNAIADAAHAEWEKAIDRYEKRLEKIRPGLTVGVQQLIGELRLHDAQLLFLGRGENQCYLALQTEQIPANIVSLEYALLREPVIDENVLPRNLQTSGCFFLYDEVDLNSRNDQAVFTHSILFTNGLHLRLKFSDVRVHVVELLIQLPETSSRSAVSRPA